MQDRYQCGDTDAVVTGSRRPPLTVGDVVAVLRLSFRAVRDLMEEPGDPLPSYVDGGGALVVDRGEFARWLRRRQGRGPGLHTVPVLTRMDRMVLAAIAATGNTADAAAVLGLTHETVRWHLHQVRDRYRAVGVTDVTLPGLLERARRDGYVHLDTPVDTPC